MLSNVDVAHTLTNLLPREAVRRRPAAPADTCKEPSCSGFILLLGVRGEHPRLAQHNIFFSSDYRREFDDIFRRGAPPDEPTVYVAITSKANPTSTRPPGTRTGSCWSMRPRPDPRFDWSTQGGSLSRPRAGGPRTGCRTRRAGTHRRRGDVHPGRPGAADRELARRALRRIAQYPRWPRSAARRCAIHAWPGSTSPAAPPIPAAVPMVMLSGRLAARTILGEFGKEHSMKSVIIIGAGMGGLAVALRLRHMGFALHRH